ncbi:MAG: GT2 family glycosyltransferase [Cyclobacteriaceae bacterium]|jgi:GT2 family glycosyltransferase
MPKVAVVILNYNGSLFLTKFLPSVIAFSQEAEIYVADNKSTDDSLEILKEFPHVKTILLESNNGYAAGYNLALQRIEAEYFVLLNSDVEVTTNWIDPVITFMDENLDVAACQPKILDFNNTSLFEYAGASGGHIDILGYPFCRGRVFNTIEKDNGQYNSAAQVFWASGACLFIRSEIFNQLGGFDEDFFAHMEEIDLCWRINLLGKKIYCLPDSHVYHVGGGTLSKTNSRKTYLNFRNNLTMIYKNDSFTSLLWKLPLRLNFDLIAGLQFWKNNSFSHFWMVILAYGHFVRDIKKSNKKRNQLQKLRRNKITFPLRKIVLPISYFLYGRKFFSDLNS